MKRQKSHDDSKIHEEYLDDEYNKLMKRTDTVQANTSTKNLFQFFFEKALGPKPAPAKSNRTKKTKKAKDLVPRVMYNPVVAMMGLQSNGEQKEKEIIAIRNKFLKIDNNHLGVNKSLELKELLVKNKVDYYDIKNMISLDVLTGHQYKIILEGGLLLCQLREIHKDRDMLITHMKQFIKNIAKSKIGNIEELEKVIQAVVPVFVVDSRDQNENLPNPILRLLVEALYSSVKKVKEAYEIAQEKQASEGEEAQKLIKDLVIRLKQT